MRAAEIMAQGSAAVLDCSPSQDLLEHCVLRDRLRAAEIMVGEMEVMPAGHSAGHGLGRASNSSLPNRKQVAQRPLAAR